LKTTIILTLLGTLAGVVVASYVVPPALSWYAEPGGIPGGGQVQAVVLIPGVIRYATSKLIQGQMIGAGIGGFLGLVLGIIVAARGRSRQPAR
jgi:hypothetical protein